MNIQNNLSMYIYILRFHESFKIPPLSPENSLTGRLTGGISPHVKSPHENFYYVYKSLPTKKFPTQISPHASPHKIPLNNQSKTNKVLRAAQQGSHFLMIFKFYTQVLILSKSSQNHWFSKTLSTFGKKWWYCTFPSNFFISKSSFIIRLKWNYVWNIFIWFLVEN